MLIFYFLMLKFILKKPSLAELHQNYKSNFLFRKDFLFIEINFHLFIRSLQTTPF